MTLLKTGAFNKLNRQFKYSNENIRLQSDRTSKIEQGMLQLLKETKEIKQHLLEYNCHMRMDTVDVSDYFPLNSDEQLQQFMKHDDEWNKRKKASHYFIWVHSFNIYMTELLSFTIPYLFLYRLSNSF